MSLAGGSGGTGAGGSGAAGGVSSMAAGMAPVYKFAEATGLDPRAMKQYDWAMNEDIKRYRQDPYGQGNFLRQEQRMQQLLQMFGGGSMA